MEFKNKRDTARQLGISSKELHQVLLHHNIYLNEKDRKGLYRLNRETVKRDIAMRISKTYQTKSFFTNVFNPVKIKEVIESDTILPIVKDERSIKEIKLDNTEIEEWTYEELPF